MRAQSDDTSPEAERVLMELLRQGEARKTSVVICVKTREHNLLDTPMRGVRQALNVWERSRVQMSNGLFTGLFTAPISLIGALHCASSISSRSSGKPTTFE